MSVLHRVDIDVQAAADAGKKAGSLFMANVKAGVGSGKGVTNIFEGLTQQMVKTMTSDVSMGLSSAVNKYKQFKKQVDKLHGVPGSYTQADLARMDTTYLRSKDDPTKGAKLLRKLQSDIGSMAADLQRAPEYSAMLQGRKDLTAGLNGIESLAARAYTAQGMGLDASTNRARFVTSYLKKKIDSATSLDELQSLQSEFLNTESSYRQMIDREAQRKKDQKDEEKARREANRAAIQAQNEKKRQISTAQKQDNKMAIDLQADSVRTAKRHFDYAQQNRHAMIQKELDSAQAALTPLVQMVKAEADAEAQARKEAARVAKEAQAEQKRQIAADQKAKKQAERQAEIAQKQSNAMAVDLQADYASTAKRHFNYAQQNRYAMIQNEVESVQTSLTPLVKSVKSEQKTLANRRSAAISELDNLIAEASDRQRLKNQFDWFPWRNREYARTPGIRASVLKFIPGLRTAGVGDPYMLRENRDVIARQLQNAKDEKEINDIRRKYEFERRHAVYQSDINRFAGRSNRWAIRDAEGNYLPTFNKISDLFGREMRKLAAAWVGVMWARMMLQPFAIGFGALTKAADTHTRQKNMYNVSLPYGMTAGKSFEQWEDESFAKARGLRMRASEYRAMVMSAAPIFHTAVYGKDYEKGALGADGKMHYQGERIVTDMAQVETIAENLHRMAKISGSTDAEMQATLRQVIQMVSKGRGNIQDIRPILESGGHMGDMIARFGFGASGAADLYKLNEKKELTADRLMKNLLSDKTSDDLRELMRRSARTWEEVSEIMKSDLNKMMLPTIRSFAAESEYGLGDKLIGITSALADSKWVGEGIRDRLDTIIEDLSSRWFDYLRIALKSLGVLGVIATGVTLVGGFATKVIGAATNFTNDTKATMLFDERIGNLGYRRFPFQSVESKLRSMLLPSNGKDNLLATTLKQAGLEKTDLTSKKGAVQLIEAMSKLTEGDIETIAGAGGSAVGSSVYNKRLQDTRSRVELAKKLSLTDITDIISSNVRLEEVRKSTDKMVDSITSGVMGGTAWLFDKGFATDPKELFGVGEGSIEAHIKKLEDERFPGHAIETNTGTTAGNTGKTAENTRKANQIQLAILKQVAGTRVINRVVHVNPNIVSNVGTIRNGIEYDQLLKDLGSTVNHAVTAYAL